jgi:hypothetical protein
MVNAGYRYRFCTEGRRYKKQRIVNISTVIQSIGWINRRARNQRVGDPALSLTVLLS